MVDGGEGPYLDCLSEEPSVEIRKLETSAHLVTSLTETII
jgi:hypothetical protein